MVQPNVDDERGAVHTTAPAEFVPGSYGQHHRLTMVDRLGVWLSGRRVRRAVPTFTGVVLADVGAGYDARFTSSVLDQLERAIVVDSALSDEIRDDPRVVAIEGVLPDALSAVADHSVDVVLCLSVLEHVDQPLESMRAFHRILAPGGCCLINVPSWRGKRWLELSAFRLGLSPRDSIDDHRRYYDPKDLWPLLVRAGFLPSQIRCFRHKLGLNTFAICGPSRLRGRARRA